VYESVVASDDDAERRVHIQTQRRQNEYKHKTRNGSSPGDEKKARGREEGEKNQA